ncbi:PEP-CTERM sorting domain-containing protein [Aquabacterium sp.]|uniref:PEP-CTERM sorting domain-containing protein n=1 Tax=Aquabacterium sp. TaxID=1872578 RepID=UPI002CE5C4ED|nr:PEP-CTERM sorting domain-containing protein [Aquabacterium sp.]HSW07629.1 PEP-CTERM sorting domain-containing protein [Aquabacterium sp.]
MRIAQRLSAFALACLPLAAAPLSASASLIGDSITGCLGNAVICNGPGNFSPPTAVVTDPGVEFSGSISDDVVTVDFSGPSGTTLTITFHHLGSHNHGYGGFGMNFLGIDDTVTGFSLLAGNTMPISGLSFGPHSLDIDFTSLLFPGDATQTAVFQIQIAEVPEPSVAALLGAAGLALMLVQRRRRTYPVELRIAQR